MRLTSFSNIFRQSNMIDIFYFHGYGSSAKTNKVELLKSVPKSRVHAFDIDIDPSISIPALDDWIMDVLLTYINDPDPILFVGTSLGGWYANILSVTFGTKAFIINGAFEPWDSLKKFNIPKDIRDEYLHLSQKYNPTIFTGHKENEYIFAEIDDVIDNSKAIEYLKNKGIPVTIAPEADHRFTGAVFIKYVVNKITNEHSFECRSF